MPKQIMAHNLPDDLLQKELDAIRRNNIIKRIWKRDHTVWKDSPDEICNRLGWLKEHHLISSRIDELKVLARDLSNEGYTRALLLGMGGSSLAAEVYKKVFGIKTGYLDLDVLDSTHPAAIKSMMAKKPPRKTVYIVSTKSGGTVETISLMNHFYDASQKILGPTETNKRFIAITDRGSALDLLAQQVGFRNIFLNNPEIGGRYSALSYFGLLPAALIGVDLEQLVKSATGMSIQAEEQANQPEENSPVWLGAVLGALSKQGRDKLTMILSPALRPFGTWIEQLIAESTGKQGQGIVPLFASSHLPDPGALKDRLFINLRLADDKTNDMQVNTLINSGQPVVRIDLPNIYGLGGEFFRWMMATAVAGWSLGINPFDQPDVESAKNITRGMIDQFHKNRSILNPEIKLNYRGIEVSCGFEISDLGEMWLHILRSLSFQPEKPRARGYLAIQAYLQQEPQVEKSLLQLKDKIESHYGIAVMTDFGPRYLHSTGQLHKGDSGQGFFIQITEKLDSDIPIPDHPAKVTPTVSFGTLIAAQALGDWQALAEKGRETVRLNLKIDPGNALKTITNALPEQAL